MQSPKETRGRGIYRDDNGLAAVEFALIAPALVSLIFLGIVFSQFYYVRYKLHAWAVAGAHLCMVNRIEASDCDRAINAMPDRTWMDNYCVGSDGSSQLIDNMIVVTTQCGEETSLAARFLRRSNLHQETASLPFSTVSPETSP